MKLTTKQIMFILMCTLLILVVVMSCIVFSHVGDLLQLSADPDTNDTPTTSSVPSSSNTPDTSSAAPPPATYADHEHEYVKVKTHAATCEQGGYTLYECSCGKIDTQDHTPALGHRYGTATVIAATCTEGGKTQRICSRCNEPEITDITTATGHKFSLWAETDVSVGTAINEQRTCSACKLVEIQSVNSSDSWLVQKTTLDSEGAFSHCQIILNPDEGGKGTTYEIYVGLSDKTLEFSYTGSALSIYYAANDTTMSYKIPSGTKIITIYADGRATPAKPVDNPEPDVPVTTGPSIPETTGPATPETTGPSTPETTGPATPETTGPATPETSGPAGSQND